MAKILTRVHTDDVKLDTRYAPIDIEEVIDFHVEQESGALRKYELDPRDEFLLVDWPNDEEGWFPAVVWPGGFLNPTEGIIRFNHTKWINEVQS